MIAQVLLETELAKILLVTLIFAVSGLGISALLAWFTELSANVCTLIGGLFAFFITLFIIHEFLL